MKKKLTALCLTAGMLLSLTACSTSAPGDAASSEDSSPVSL